MKTLTINEEGRKLIAPLFEKQQYAKNCITVSEIKTLVTDKFDSDKVAGELEEKNFNNHDSKYYNMTKAQILESWSNKAKESMNYGKLLDEAAEHILEKRDEDEYEMFLLDNCFDDDMKFASEVNALNDFISSCEANGIEYISREIPIKYDIPNTDWSVKGRIDCLLYNKKTNKYIIIDWKTDDTIDTVPNRWTKPCLGTASQFLQLNGHTYTLQIYAYKMALLQSALKDVEPSNIQCFIVNCPKYKTDEQHLYRCYPAQADYNEAQLEKIFAFCAKKKALLNKKN